MENRVRELRKAKGMTMKQLGVILGVAESTVSQYETGKRQLDNEILLKLSEFFDVTIGYILGVENDIKKPLVNNDEELTQFLETLRTRPECRMLLSITKDATKADVEKAVAIIEALRKTEGRE